MKLCVVGTGYVGLTAAVSLAHLGHTVTGVDADQDKVEALQKGRVPFFEPGVARLLAEGMAANRLRFTPSLPEGLAGADAVFITVGTPQGSDGAPDLEAVQAAVDQLAVGNPHPRPVIIKSTVPVGTGDRLEHRLRAKTGKSWHVVSNPEFLREGSAVTDFLRPDRVVIGAESPEAARIVRRIYTGIDAPMLLTSRRTAELIKYAANAFLATKISFINEIADLCERVRVDVTHVSRGLGLDRRIGPHFLQAGLGYGGSCFPKDVAALRWQFTATGLEPAILAAVHAVNAGRRARFVQLVRSRLGELKGQSLAVWGLSFKPNTDDLRDSPALDIIPALVAHGARVRVYDPAVGPLARSRFPSVRVARSPLDAADGAAAVLLLTDWPEFAQVDLGALKARMARALLVDGRNQLDPAACRAAGFEYCSLGRPPVPPPV
ncbi:MAG: UDP-glucose/GDP-mannose dehydrogenase family protein [Firmicutes bacterium]|nr:UDP-glucose/GDP-mannose dehydrogenase family protein [Bacillota bacterium]